MKTIVLISAHFIFLSVLTLNAQDLTNCVAKLDSILNRDVYVLVDNMPQFKKGKESLNEYLKENLKYPVNECIEGAVYVSFIVETDGQLSNIKVTKGISDKSNKNAIKAIESMPNWKPGTCNGKQVPTQIIIPIRFNL
jgi:protein TonB